VPGAEVDSVSREKKNVAQACRGWISGVATAESSLVLKGFCLIQSSFGGQRSFILAAIVTDCDSDMPLKQVGSDSKGEFKRRALPCQGHGLSF
jgi:hypothetical protein